MKEEQSNHTEDCSFAEFRRKIQLAEVLSASIERLLHVLHFTGRVCLIIQNGRVLKAGYEESYFRQGEPEPAVSSMR